MSNQTQIKVMKSKPELKDEEIRSHMDFDKLLQMHKSAGAGLISTTPKWVTIAAYVVPTVVVITTVLYVTAPWKTTEHQPNQNPEQVTQLVMDSVASTETKISEPSTEEPVVKPSSEIIQRTEAIKTEDNKVAVQTDKRKLTIAKFTQAEPVDGYPALYEYFNRDLKYPQEMVKDSIEGVVTVSFAINEFGKPESIKIQNSLGEAFDKESIRVIENMPVWKAATIDGKATVTRMSIPLTFRIIKK
jgi:TonB family protein